MTVNPDLQQMKDIHIPPAILMWPTAPGWIILYIILSTLLCYCIYCWYRRRKQLQTIHYAVQQLNLLRNLMNNNPENVNIVAEISTLIRRTALYYYKRDAIAGLCGQEWLKFLNDSGQTSQFTESIGQLLIDAPYRKNAHAEIQPLLDLTQDWLTVIARKNRKEIASHV